MNLIPISVTPIELVALWNLRQLERTTLEPPKLGDGSKKSAVITCSAGNFYYVILGERRNAKNAVEAYINILSELSILEPSLPIQLALVAPGNSRNHIAKSAAEVYPQRQDLWKNSIMFAPGWFAGTNIANREKIRILDLACKILQLEFGSDVIFG